VCAHRVASAIANGDLVRQRINLQS